MKNWLLYVLLTLAFAFIASGVVVSAFIDTYQHLGLQITMAPAAGDSPFYGWGAY